MVALYLDVTILKYGRCRNRRNSLYHSIAYLNIYVSIRELHVRKWLYLL